MLLIPLWAAADGDPRLVESRELAARLQQQLGARLVSALSAGGPAEAIEACRVDAPEIAQRLSGEAGARVGRTALKVRNPANASDPEQQAVMHEFARLLDLGAGPPERFDIRSDGGARYMRAIVTQPMCLACHGASLAPEVSAALARLYPQDQATGFAAGELRGAFVIEWPPTAEPRR